MNERLSEIVSSVREKFPEVVSEPEEDRGEVSVDVSRDRLTDVARAFRDTGPFELLADLSAVDFWNRGGERAPLGDRAASERFLVACHLYSFRRNLRLRLRVWVPEGDPTCPSLTGIWPAAGYMEREAYDFFGIVFAGHPDLRRILMPDDWEGHPQRKDYPLGGTNVEYKGAWVPPPDLRRQPTTTTGYPGRIS